MTLVQLYRVVPTLEEIFLTLVHQADEEAEREELNRQREGRLRVLRRKKKRGALTAEELEELTLLAPEEAADYMQDEAEADADISETEEVSEEAENEEENGGDEA